MCPCVCVCVLKVCVVLIKEWSGHDPPESDNSGCFYTTVGILLYEMIDQNVTLMLTLILAINVTTDWCIVNVG